MSRLLTASEVAGFLIRHPLYSLEFGLDSNYQSVMVSDSEIGTVLLFRKTDGTILAIECTKEVPDPSVRVGASVIGNIYEEVKNNASNVFDKVFNLLQIAVVGMAIYLAIIAYREMK